MHHKAIGRRTPPEPAGELTALPKTPRWLYGVGPTLRKGKERERWRGREGGKEGSGRQGLEEKGQGHPLVQTDRRHCSVYSACNAAFTPDTIARIQVASTCIHSYPLSPLCPVSATKLSSRLHVSICIRE